MRLKREIKGDGKNDLTLSERLQICIFTKEQKQPIKLDVKRRCHR